MRTPLFLLGTLLCGCASVARPPDSERVARIEIGKTLKRDVVEMLGLPNRVARVPGADGESCERWFYFRRADITVIQTARVAVGAHRNLAVRKDVAAIVEFSSDGRVVEVARGEDLK